MDRPLFNSFWQAGFECSTQVIKTGKRLDLVSSSGHDRFAHQDFARLSERGIQTAREGLRWHLIETAPGKYDFTSALHIMQAAQRHGIQLIWDLLHFGWPANLDIFSNEWVQSFAEFSSAFARVLSREMTEAALIAPINEISFLSWAGGDVAHLNPFGVNRGAELKRQLVRGAIQASEALLTELPHSRLVSPEPVIHIVGDPCRPEDGRQAAEYRSSMFEAWDMLSGRVHPELGGDERYLDVIGVNYYDSNQWWNFGKTIFREEPEYRPFREILAEVHRRYHRPMFISETGTENDDRPSWLAYVAGEARAAMQNGVPVHGICLYPILNHPGWDDGRHCYNGLWDYPRADGAREIYGPLAAELERQKRLVSKQYETPTNLSEPNRPDLPFPPSLELRLSAAAAPDEQICPGAPRVLCGGTGLSNG